MNTSSKVREKQPVNAYIHIEQSEMPPSVIAMYTGTADDATTTTCYYLCIMYYHVCIMYKCIDALPLLLNHSCIQAAMLDMEYRRDITHVKEEHQTNPQGQGGGHGGGTSAEAAVHLEYLARLPKIALK